jgi:hypothetical protein
MVIFHSYVSLPEGIFVFPHFDAFTVGVKWVKWKIQPQPPVWALRLSMGMGWSKLEQF